MIFVRLPRFLVYQGQVGEGDGDNDDGDNDDGNSNKSKNKIITAAVREVLLFLLTM